MRASPRAPPARHRAAREQEGRAEGPAAARAPTGGHEAVQGVGGGRVGGDARALACAAGERGGEVCGEELEEDLPVRGRPRAFLLLLCFVWIGSMFRELGIRMDGRRSMVKELGSRRMLLNPFFGFPLDNETGESLKGAAQSVLNREKPLNKAV